jgi:hypothetical protein
LAKPKFKLTPILRRAIPTIACINSAADENLKANFDQLVSALQIFLDNCFAPIWGTPAKLVTSKVGINNAWTLIFPDDANAASKDNGLHQMTLNGCPLAKVFVKSTLSAHEKVSVAACHELAEMLVDPGVNMWADGPKGTLWAYEVCDAVEETTFRIERTFMSDFVYPAYFELFRTNDPESSQFDYLKRVKEPFQLLSGGYSSIRNGKMIKEIFGSNGKKRRFEREDRRLHRSEYRRTIVQSRCR